MSPMWTSRILFRTGSERDFCWFDYPGEYEPASAEIAAQRLICEGLTVLVCMSDEYRRIGLPQTFAGDEYYQDKQAAPPVPRRQAPPRTNRRRRTASVHTLNFRRAR